MSLKGIEKVQIVKVLTSFWKIKAAKYARYNKYMRSTRRAK